MVEFHSFPACEKGFFQSDQEVDGKAQIIGDR